MVGRQFECSRGWLGSSRSVRSGAGHSGACVQARADVDAPHPGHHPPGAPIADQSSTVEAMRTRKLGPLEVSVVGLGCNNFGGRVDEEGTRAVVDAALDAGVTFFDTADSYGNQGGSETILGHVLRGRRDRVVLATKFGMEMGDGATQRGSRDYILHALEGSLRRLQTDVIDLYQHHEEDPESPLEETIGALD